MKNTISLLAGACLASAATVAHANPALPMNIADFLVPIPAAAPAGGDVVGPQLAELFPTLRASQPPAPRPLRLPVQRAR